MTLEVVFDGAPDEFFPDGSSSRPPVEGTVPRQAGPYRDREDYLYTGKAAGGDEVLAVGGSVVNGVCDRGLDWATFICEYSFFSPPVVGTLTQP